MRRRYAEAIVVVAAIALLALAIVGYTHRVAERAESRARIARDSALIASLQTRLHRQDSATVHAIGDTHHALEHYDTVRLHGRVDTVRLTLPGHTDTVSVEAVPLGTMAAADTVAKKCSLLVASCAAFRIAADSTMAAQARIISEYRKLPPQKSRIAISVFGGVCTDAKPCIGAGLSWSVIRF